MNAPLSLFLTQFSSRPPPQVEVPPMGDLDTVDAMAFDLPEDPVDLEPMVRMTEAEFEAKLAAAAEDARSEAAQQHAVHLSETVAAHETALSEGLEAARSEWLVEQSDRLVASLDGVIEGLRTKVGEGIANVLRPLMADMVMARVKTELIEALDRLLADPTQPLLTVTCPEDLGATLREARPDASIEWAVGETVEVSIAADATRIETRIAAALADLMATEHDNGG